MKKKWSIAAVASDPYDCSHIEFFAEKAEIINNGYDLVIDGLILHSEEGWIVLKEEI